MLEKYLEDLERRLAPDIEEALLAEWQRFTNGEFRGEIFSPRRLRAAPAAIAWPEVCVNDALDDFESMALQQFAACSAALAESSGKLLAVRCNYGTGIMPSLFGAELFIMERAANTLPTTKPLPGGVAAIEALLARGVPEVAHGLGGKVFAMGQYFADILQPYPNLKRYVHLYHPDTQGPLDICELLWGSTLFLDLIDHPEMVKALLELITATYMRFMDAWARIAPFAQENNVHWSLLHKGQLMLRDDSAMNLSAKMFAEFVQPYDQRLLDRFGGGAIHFCGKGSHYIHHLAEMRGVHAIQMSQPEYNDLAAIFAHTIDCGRQLLDFPRNAAEQALRQGRDLRGHVHCW